jgi:hypothetical protein
MTMKTLRNLKRRVRNLLRQYDRMVQLEAARAIETGTESDLIDEDTYLRNKGFKGLAFLCEASLAGWAKTNRVAILGHYAGPATSMTPKVSKLLGYS